MQIKNWWVFHGFKKNSFNMFSQFSRSQDIAFLSLYYLLAYCFYILNFIVTPWQLGTYGLISPLSNDGFAVWY